MTLGHELFTTRLGRRIFGLFVLGALIPTGALAVISYHHVRSQLTDEAQRRLRQSSKTVGMTVLERLQFVEIELRTLAGDSVTVARPARYSPQTTRYFRAATVVMSTGDQRPLFGTMDGPGPLTPAQLAHLRNRGVLLVTRHRPQGVAVLMGVLTDPPRSDSPTVWAELNPTYVWPKSLALTETEGEQICLLTTSYEPLVCPHPIPTIRDRQASDSDLWRWRDADTDYVADTWEIFLGYSFGTRDWIVVASEARDSVLAPIASFKYSFALSVGVALGIVALLSNVQIRRTLIPLAKLRAGIRRMGKRHLVTPLVIDSGDEFEELADSFNEMADQLNTQFREGEELTRELARAANRQHEQSSRLNAILAAAPEGIVTVDERGAIESVNEAGEEMFGCQEHGLLGQAFHTIAPSVFETLSDGPSAVMQRGEVVGVRRDGSTFPLAYAARSVDLRGRTVYTVILRDLTERERAAEERRQLETQLRTAQKMESIGTLAGGIAHDFLNLLTPILGYAELARSALPPNHSVQTDLDYIRDAGGRAKNLVRQILLFSRQGEADRRPVEIGPIVNEAVSLLRASLPSTIDLRVHTDPDVGSVVADATQIHQIVMNLCTNAYQAMPDGGVLEIGVSADRPPSDHLVEDQPPAVLLTVRDTGTGMDEDTRHRLFDPFFTTKPVGQGTGLGLSVVHGIVTSHGGTMEVESALGEGTAFSVRFPSIDVPAATNAAPVAVALPQGHEHVLVVDDEPAIVTLQCRMLEQLGYRTTAAADGAEALERISASPTSFQLVITDETMPRLTGTALIRELQKINRNLPVILTTGMHQTLSDHGNATEFLAKPVRFTDLAVAVRRVLDRTA